MNPTQKQVTQTILKAAAKTFAQAFVGILLILAVPVLTSWATTVSNGGDIVIDTDLLANVLIAATGAGIAALISFVGNSLKA